MIIEISASGGFGGIAGAGMTKRIDVDAQSAAVRDELCARFEPQELGELAAQSRRKGAADLTTYQIRLTDRQQGEHVYRIREDQIPPDMLDLIDSF